MKSPKISIVTPNYNQAEFIEETILSVLGQNYKNLEYIIIDGGSTDGSVNIIKKYEKHLAYWVSEPDAGLYYALQKGFDKATGEVMGWINSDDKLHVNSLQVIAEVFGSFEEVNWLTGCMSGYDEKGRTFAVVSPQKWSKYHFYINEYKWIQQESTFWRKSLWNKAGARLNVDIKYAADFELWLRFFRYEKLYTIQTILGGFRLRSNQISALHREKYIKEVEGLIIEELKLLPKEIKNRISNYKRGMNLVEWVRKLKVFNTEGLMRRIKKQIDDSPRSIEFDAVSQSFKLTD
jgi:glycosyltransferase involved in cell wall biosynthesis